MFRYTPPWSEGDRPYVVVYGKKAAAARIVYPDGETMTGELMQSPANSPTLKLSISGIGGQNRRIRIEEANNGDREEIQSWFHLWVAM